MTVLLLLGSTAVFTSFWFFTLLAGPGLYFVWTVTITWTLAGAFIVFPLAAFTTFGQEHYASNYGLICTAQVCCGVMCCVACVCVYVCVCVRVCVRVLV